MFALFKRRTKKEFYKRMEECRRAHEYLSNTNPFEAIPNEYQKNSNVMA